VTDHSVDTPWPHFVWSKRACTHGGASGDGCGKVGVQTVNAGAIGAGTSSLNPGDDGEPLTVGDRLVGLVFKGGADMSRAPGSARCLVPEAFKCQLFWRIRRHRTTVRSSRITANMFRIENHAKATAAPLFSRYSRKIHA